MMIEQSTIDRIIDSSRIEEVVGDFISLKKRGVNFIGNCPFHNEKTPSFTVSPSKGIYKCFGCGVGGNSVNFVMEHEQISYVEALKYLAKKYHIEIVEKEISPEQIQQKNHRESMMIVSSFAQKYFTEQLFNSNEGKAIGLSYFKERGFRDDIIKKFQLGYSINEFENFTNAALQNGYKLEYLEKTGLSILKNNKGFDRFRGRVMFPIHTLMGKVIAFGGRVLKIDPEKKTAKYLNSPDSEIYNKGTILYGLYFAKKSIVKEDKCFLVEGYTDVLSMHQAGIENVVASSGTALSPTQVRLIRRFTKNITILFDGDAAGIKASFRGIDLILEEDLNVKVLLLPDGEDPDSFAKGRTATEFIDYINKNQEDFITFKTRLLLGETENDPIKKAALITNIVDTISLIPSIITQSVYVKSCSEILSIDEKVLYQQLKNDKLKKIHKSDYKNINEPKFQQTPQNENAIVIASDNHCDFQEREILRLLILYGTKEVFSVMREGRKEAVIVKDYIFSEISEGEMYFLNSNNKMIFDEYYTICNSKKDALNEKTFTQHQNTDISKYSIEILNTKNSLSRFWFKNDNHVETEENILKLIIPQTVLTYKKKRIEIAIKETNESIKKATSDSEAIELMQRLMSLNKYREILSKDLKRTF